MASEKSIPTPWKVIGKSKEGGGGGGGLGKGKYKAKLEIPEYCGDQTKHPSMGGGE